MTDHKVLNEEGDQGDGAESRLPPSCKIRLGTNGETSRVFAHKFTVMRHKNRSCKYMEDMYCDNEYINMTPTRCSVLFTSESGDELISLRGQFIGRAEQHLLQHFYIPGPCGKSCTDWTLWKVVFWTVHTTMDARGCQ